MRKIQYSKKQAEMYRLAKTDPDNSYYVYIHRRLSDNNVFYVGKGKSNRGWANAGRNIYWKRVVEKHGCYVEVVFENLTNQEAYELEKDVILEFTYFNEPLTNLTAGGEGGLNPSAETRHKQSVAKKGKKPHNFGKRLPAISMEKNGCSDKNTYVFVHQDGTLFKGSRYDLVKLFDLNLSMIGKLFYKGSGRRKRIFGWSILEVLSAN